jgi:hypothetical protein
LTEGSAACLLGLICGGLLLAGQHYIAQQAVVQRLLAFSAASFFTCVTMHQNGELWQLKPKLPNKNPMAQHERLSMRCFPRCRYLLPPVIFYAGLSIEKQVGGAVSSPLCTCVPLQTFKASTKPAKISRRCVAVLACSVFTLQLFFTNLGSILCLGIVGTAVSATVLAGLLAAGFAGLKLLRLQVRDPTTCVNALCRLLM